MTDLVHQGLKLLDHHRYTMLAVLLTIAMALYAGGCASHTTGLDGQRQVTRSQLRQQVLAHQQQLAVQIQQIEVQKQKALAQARQAQDDLTARTTALGVKSSDLKAQFQQRIADLDRQDVMKKQVFGQIGALLTSLAAGTVNPVNAVAGAIGLGSLIFGAGASADNRRKDKLIAKQSAPA